MHPTALYLKWVKDTYPAVFAVAVRKAQQKSSLGGLGDDLVSDVSVDTSAVSVDPAITQAVDDAATSTVDTSGWSGFLDALSSAVTTVAPQIVQTKAQLSQIQINQQRAQQGLGPLGTSNLSSNTLLIGGGLALLLGAVLLSRGHSR